MGRTVGVAVVVSSGVSLGSVSNEISEFSERLSPRLA